MQHKHCLWQWCQWVNQIYYKNVGCQDDEVHQQADTHEVAEAVAAGAIYQHVGGRAYGGGETAAHADHQGNKEGIGFGAQFLRRLENDGEEHGSRRRVGDKLSDKRGDETSCKDEEVERNGKTCFGISGSCVNREKRNLVFFSEMKQRRRSQMKYLRERSESKIRKFHKPSKESMNLLRRVAGHYHIIGDEVTLLLLGSGMS